MKYRYKLNTLPEINIEKKFDCIYAIESLYYLNYDEIGILINNAAKDPKVKKGGGLKPDSRFETMSEEYWFEGINAALNGTFLCSQVAANKMLKNGGGVILNISSDLGVIAPRPEDL